MTKFHSYDDATDMTLDEYQKKAYETAIYPGKGTIQGLTYAALGLGEAGEVQGKIKKILRDDGGVLNESRRAAILKELGDLQWYCAVLAKELDATLSCVAESNLDNLYGRLARGTLNGDGDNR